MTGASHILMWGDQSPAYSSPTRPQGRCTGSLSSLCGQSLQSTERILQTKRENMIKQEKYISINSLAPSNPWVPTLCGVMVLALLPEHGVSDLFQSGVKAPAARLILPGWVDGLVLQQLGRRAPQSGVPLQGSLQEGTHGQTAVLRYVLQRGGLLVDLLGRATGSNRCEGAESSCLVAVKRNQEHWQSSGKQLNQAARLLHESSFARK